MSMGAVGVILLISNDPVELADFCRSALGVQAAYERLISHGVDASPPFDHGFAVLTAFRDPDGHNVQVMQVAG